MAADWPAGAGLLAVAPAGRSAASYTITRDTTVVVSVTYALRDSSGFFDDAYNGTVQVLTMVDRA